MYLGSAASDGISGKLISAIWDPWDNLAAYRTELNGSEIYTLRRILPEDSGVQWGAWVGQSAVVGSSVISVPARSPLGAVGYQVWKHAFSLQHPRGALLAVEKTHWAACT